MTYTRRLLFGQDKFILVSIFVAFEVKSFFWKSQSYFESLYSRIQMNAIFH